MSLHIQAKEEEYLKVKQAKNFLIKKMVSLDQARQIEMPKKKSLSEPKKFSIQRKFAYKNLDNVHSLLYFLFAAVFSDS